MKGNQSDTDPLARTEQLANLLDAAVPYLARQLIVALPASRRSDSESYFLHDCARGRREASRETLVRLMDLSGRADKAGLVSDMIRALEVRHSPPESQGCVYEASYGEQDANEPLNKAQMMAHQEKCPTRWSLVWELCKGQLRATQRLMDAAARHMHMPSHRRAV